MLGCLADDKACSGREVIGRTSSTRRTYPVILLLLLWFPDINWFASLLCRSKMLTVSFGVERTFCYQKGCQPFCRFGHGMDSKSVDLDLTLKSKVLDSRLNLFSNSLWTSNKSFILASPSFLCYD